MTGKTLNPGEILSSLGITDVTQIEPVTGGTATAVWRVLWEDRQYVMRVFNPDQVAVCKREVAAMEVATEGGIHVPEIIRHGLWEDRPVLLLSWLKGEPMLDYLRQHPRQVWKLGAAWGRIHAALNKLPAPSTFDSNEWINWAGEDESELITRLREIEPRRAMLLHLDYHPNNVMVDNGKVGGILDWANARAGDPRADYARTCVLLRFARFETHPDPPHIQQLRANLERAWQRGYAFEAGEPEEMAVFHAWAAAAMIRDLLPLLDQPDSGFTDEDIEPIRRWRDTWKRRAGLRPKTPVR